VLSTFDSLKGFARAASIMSIAAIGVAGLAHGMELSRVDVGAQAPQ